MYGSGYGGPEVGGVCTMTAQAMAMYMGKDMKTTISAAEMTGRCFRCARQCHNIAEDGKRYCGDCCKKRQTRAMRGWQHFANGADTSKDSDDESVGICRDCNLPLGDAGYYDESGKATVHAECMARRIVDDAQKCDDAHQLAAAEKKRTHREMYDIGWKVERVPRNLAPAGKLGCELSAAHGHCSLVLEEGSQKVRVVETADPALCVNLEYLSLALQVRRKEGREPLFSLEPKDAAEDPRHLMQTKVFEPAWLVGTSVGEIMFQADYYLKELSMGEHDQPVMGMKSCFDLSEAEGLGKQWSAREWFVVKSANVYMSSENALIPQVEMGVEAREQITGPNGIEEAPITRPDHPLVKYAEQFTRKFDLIAERKSAIYHLRELARASVLAKFMLDGGVSFEGSWLDLVDWARVKDAATACLADVPQLWTDRCHSKVRVEDGAILGAQEGVGPSIHCVYGGVQFGLERFMLPSLTPLALSIGPVPIANKAPPAVDTKGVDLNLDRFHLVAPERVELKRSARAVCGGAFWSMLDSSDKADEEICLLRDIFNPQLSDRRDEGDLFVAPNPSPSYMHRLQVLVKEERKIKRDRRAHFLSPSFAPGDAGPLFPTSWTSPITITCAQVPRQLDARLFDDGVDLNTLRSREPAFDAKTEDGLRYRVYRDGELEVRTTQEHDGAETIGAVFSTGASVQASIVGSERVVKVTEYVAAPARTASGQAAPDRPRHCYYVVLETASGNVVLTERLLNGAVAWAELPECLDDRNARARVIGSVDCRRANITVQDLRSYAVAVSSAFAVSPSECKRYAHSAYNWACSESGRAPPVFLSFGAKRGAKGAPPGGGEAVGAAARGSPGAAAAAVRKQRLAALFGATDQLRSDREVTLAAVEHDGRALKDASDELRADHGVALAAVRERGTALEFAAERLQDDVEVVRAAVQQEGMALRFASSRLRQDHELVLTSVRQNGEALAHASEALRECRDIALAAVSNDTASIRFVAQHFLADRDFILAAVQKDAAVLEHAADELLTDHHFVLAAMQTNSTALEHVPCALRASREFMLEIVRKNCFALKFASEELRADHDVVLAALQQDHQAIEYADRERLLQSYGSLPAELRGILDRRAVQVAADPQARPIVTALAAGDRVRVVGLERQPELDGSKGSLVDLAEQGWMVRLDGQRVDKLFKQRNVERLSAPVALPAPGSMDIAGTWNGWRPQAMSWDAEHRCYHFGVTLGDAGQESFQIWAGGSPGACLHPDEDGACPYFDYGLCGLDASGEGRNWAIGKHPLDQGARGASYRVRLFLTENGSADRVDWVREGTAAASLQRPGPAVAPLFKHAPLGLPQHSSVTIVGSWDGWAARGMGWSAFHQCYFHRLKVGGEGRESFQVLLDGRWDKCLHPDRADACSGTDHRLCGPDDRGHEKNWVITADAAGAWYEVRLFLSSNGSAERVDWLKLTPSQQRQAAAAAQQERSVRAVLPEYKQVHVVGTWSGWAAREMDWDARRRCYHSTLQVGSEGWASFQILLDGDWARCLHPNKADANPHTDYKLCGPDNAGHGMNWTIGKHQLDVGAKGARYEVRLFLSEYGHAETVDWTQLSP